MNVFFQLAHQQLRALAFVIALSIVSAFLSVGVIAFIQMRFLSDNVQRINESLIEFFGLLIVLLISATMAQVSLHRLGHKFVYNKRCELVKQLINTDIEQIEKVGSAGLLASLNTDVRNVTIAFVHLPELVYGAVLSVVALAYLAFLSLPLFGVSLFVLSLTGVIGFWLVTRITYHVRQVREYDDKLYADYQAFIDGRKELSLNPGRAQRYFNDVFNANASGYRDEVTRADVLNGFAANLANTVVLALIGLNYYLSIGLGWASFSVASAFALIILFMRTPLMAAVSALPTLVTANVSMKKLSSLSLNTETHFSRYSTRRTYFCSLALKNVTYKYQSDNDEAPFTVGPIDFKVNRGDLVFVIGGNGSGKSTFARLLTGLFRPQSGDVIFNDINVSPLEWQIYRQHFSAVFTDFYLFSRITNGDGHDIDPSKIDEWMTRLDMAHKVSHKSGLLSDVRYSQGQRKRLALLMAVMEERSCILLDEWAADQDPAFRDFFYRHLLPLLKSRGVTVIAITHDDKYFDVADRVFKMETGQLTELDSNQKHIELSRVVNMDLSAP